MGSSCALMPGCCRSWIKPHHAWPKYERPTRAEWEPGWPWRKFSRRSSCSITRLHVYPQHARRAASMSFKLQRRCPIDLIAGWPLTLDQAAAAVAKTPDQPSKPDQKRIWTQNRDGMHTRQGPGSIMVTVLEVTQGLIAGMTQTLRIPGADMHI